MVRGMPVVLDRGEAGVEANCDRDRDCRFFTAFLDESSARIPWTLFARRMDRIRHLGRAGDGPACLEVERKLFAKLQQRQERIQLSTESDIRAKLTPRVYF